MRDVDLFVWSQRARASGATAEGGGKAGRLGELPVRKVCVDDGVFGVGDVGVDAGKPNGKDRSRLGDPGVIEICHAGHAYLGERVAGYQRLSHGLTVRSAKGRGRGQSTNKGSGDDGAGGGEKTHGGILWRLAPTTVAMLDDWSLFRRNGVGRGFALLLNWKGNGRLQLFRECNGGSYSVRLS